MSARVVVYTREGCGLCRAAEEAAATVAAARGESVVTVDVDTDPELVAAHGARVPVVAVDGDEVGEFVVDEATIAKALDTAR
ncbi:glutaredoxin family protein [Egibacter rhizosphaerae]|uniref:Glutaredoxin family protein n=1 Tax=Egibacter rhizosphaerae TaxID=1670831 RepID=A0A411YGB8_9ACTN|nr:glutaredoxin family protein [Egibacter rhizosphaerae]QBI20325.1 glutaredoxin family protein [Egibacter rhizosphaerae]